MFALKGHWIAHIEAPTSALLEGGADPMEDAASHAGGLCFACCCLDFSFPSYISSSAAPASSHLIIF